MPSITNQRINVADLDFDNIKVELQRFLENQNNINDYQYTGSAINTILDAFAYVTHFNAFNANLAVNESFLDSAQLRSSVVSHAKLLGYLPGSAQPARATVNITISNPTGVLNTDGSYRALTLQQGTRFSSRIGNRTLTFVPEKTISTNRNLDGEYVFENVILTQGTYRTDQFVYDDETAEEFELTSPNPVISTLQVTVQASETDSTIETFEFARNLIDLDGNTNAYFMNENRREYYQVSFGDGVIGKKLQNGNIVFLRYIVTDVGQGDGATTFTLADNINGNTENVVVEMVDSASGSGEREDMRSIKFNAPLTFVSQNRAVTPNDYKSIIQQGFTNIQAISVWGGEDNDPPNYGTVYISIAPMDKESLNVTEKAFIENQLLKPKNIVSITPIFTDPAYTYIDLQVFFKYNPNITNLGDTGIAAAVRETIRNYNNVELRKFDGVFRASNLLRLIDDADVSIISSIIRVSMSKRFVPELEVERRYDITFSSPIFNGPQQESVIQSSRFQYLSRDCILRDKKMGNTRVIQIVSINETIDGVAQVINNNIGTVNESAGQVSLIGFSPTSFVGDYIEITAIPESDDLAPRRNELLSILVDKADITGEIDTIITGGTFAGVGYRTIPKYNND